MEFRDYYATLGVKKTATEGEIKRAYRKLARKHHPDLNPGDKAAEGRFKEINEAHAVLGSPETRRKFDELGANWRAYENVPSGAAGGTGRRPGPGDPRGRYQRGRSMTPDEMKDLFGGGDLFSDFFQTFFSGGSTGPAPSPRPTPGRNLEQPVTLTLDEAFAGTTRRIAISGGAVSRTVEVRIPAGVRDGARVRASGEGAASDTGGPAGDLYLSVRISPHAVFERRGDDLHARVAVPLTTAVLGGEATAPVLSGPAPRLKVPELTRPGRVFRLRGHGMPVLGGGGTRGDLYVALDLSMPAHLSPEARAHFEALKALDDKDPS